MRRLFRDYRKVGGQSARFGVGFSTMGMSGPASFQNSLTQPGEKVDVCSIRVAQHGGASTPGLIGRLCMESDSARHQLSMHLVNVIHQEADVVNARGIQAQVKGLAGNGFTPRQPYKEEQFRGPSYHRAHTFILRGLDETKALVELDTATEIRNSYADIVHAQNHAAVSRLHSTSEKRTWERTAKRSSRFPMFYPLTVEGLGRGPTFLEETVATQSIAIQDGINLKELLKRLSTMDDAQLLHFARVRSTAASNHGAPRHCI